jgi:hypothetical protein
MYLPRVIAPSTLLAALWLSGCSVAPTAAAARIMEADASMVQTCKYLGEVQGSSGWGNLAASTGMENAKNEARDSAAKLGATHIVWSAVAGGNSPYATGKAYKC